MLQRQIMYKQIQEMQRRQQLQDMCEGKKQNYVNQLPSQMCVVGDMDMIQHGGSATFRSFSTGLGLSKPQNLAGRSLGFSQQQFGVPLYSHLGESSNDSANLLVTNKNSPLEIPTMQPSAFSNSVISQRSNFSSDQLCIPDGALLPNQVFEEKNFFGQGLVPGFNEGNLHETYFQQGNSQQRNTSILESEERQKQAGLHGLAPGNMPKPGPFLQPGTSLDPLEQKILYNTDDNADAGGIASTLELTSYMDELPSKQSGSWSALMQSAVAETSSGDTGVLEGWSGLSIQNPESSTENKALNYIDSGKQQNNWVDLPSSKSEVFSHNSNMNHSFPGFQQSGDQFLKQREESHAESSHSFIQQSPRNANKSSDYSPQQKHPVDGSQMIQTSSPVPNLWLSKRHEHLKNDTYQSSFMSYSHVNGPFSSLAGHESRDTLHGTTPQHVTNGSQKPFNQVHHPKNQLYSIESAKMAPGNNFVPTSSLFGSLSHPHIQSVTARTSESTLNLLNKDDISIEHAHGSLNSNDLTQKEVPLPETSASFGKSHNISSVPQGFGLRLGLADQQTPQSYSFFQTLSGNSSATSPSSHLHLQNHHPSVPPVTSHWTSQIPAYNADVSFDNGPFKSSHLYDQELPTLGSVPVTQPSLTSGASRHVGLPMGQSNVWPDLLQSSDLALSSLQDTADPSHEQHKQENGVQEYGTYSGISDCNELQSGKEGPPQYGSAGVDSSISRSIFTHEHESVGKNLLEADVKTGSLMQHSNMAHQRGNQNPLVPAIDAGVGNTLMPLYSLNQNHSFPHPMQMPLNPVEGDSRRLPIKCDGIDFGINSQQPGQKSGVNDMEKNDAFQSPSIGSNEDSNMTCPSQISLQMAPSWFKHYGTFKNEQMRPLFDANAEIIAVSQISGSTLPNLQTNSSIMQVNSAREGSSIWPVAVASKQLSPANVLPSDVTYQNLAVTRPKKRKIIPFELVPWHKEVTQNSRRLQNISTAELEWAQATNKIFEEVKMEAIVFEDTHPVIRAKRRLIFTTQLMQQVFQPAPKVILSADASSNYDFMAYFAARLTLGDACSLATSSQFPSDTSDKSPEKLKTSKRTGAYDFSKIAEGFTSQMKILKGNMLRLDKSLSITDIKAEAQELEKISIINRLAKFHGRAHQGVDAASSSGTSSMQKHLQRYVIAVPMPKTVPEETNCLLL
ncbi:uncharacterized protein LOC111400915 [Olea europaea var. sylvestris]|uniref:uncharacterized protein LOC111400915 n=1 Tax=Olea europaea var. sylvestris TaxID=158386 RepID=UPI000C1D386B|nr:uncharacterized protein LOC111400915 [Olea europaea var. sylvestris]XP_022884150.1 uncharacterized protein LOC111400915 [Olea europaea var. sylvestris]